MIPYGRHDISEDDIAAVVDVLRGDWLTTGPAVETFEADLCDFIGGTPVVAVSSGTAALHVAYAAAGIGVDDEIITPPLTFVATQAAAMHLGAQPVFVDVLPDTGNINPELVLAAVTPRTKAIVAVDYAGHPADLNELRAIADARGLLLIEDAAHSIGSAYRGRTVGSIADITTFSFYPTKNITTGEGGAVACRDPEVLERARLFARQGLVRDALRFFISGQGAWHQEVHEIGLNYRLPDMNAALGSSQLKRLHEFKVRRAQIKALYDAAFSDIKGLSVPTQRDYVDPMWHLYPLRVPRARRQQIFDGLRAGGIGVQVNYMPAHWHPAVARQLQFEVNCPVAEAFFESEISLPMFASLGESMQEGVIAAVLQIAAGNGK